MNKSIPLEPDQNWWWYKAKINLLDFILSKDLGKKNLTILEVGPGLGNNIEILKKYGSLDILEVDKYFLENLKINNSKSINEFYSDIDQIKNKYDLIVLLDVLEHVEEPIQLLNDLGNILFDNGKLVIGVPANKSLWSVHDEHLDHFRRYDWETFLKHTSIFTINKKYGFNYFLLPIRYIQVKYFNKIDTLKEKGKIMNEFLYFVTKIEHLLRKIYINPKVGISIYGVFSKK